jgi:prevent-host-death family protein
MVQPLRVAVVTTLSRFGGAINLLKYRQNVQNSHASVLTMQTYTLTDARNKHGEVFDKAAIEPVLLTKQSRPSHVIISAESYQKLINRLTELEDMLLGQAAEVALSQSKMVGTDNFTNALERLANGEA